MCRCWADADDGKCCTCPLKVRHFISFAHFLANFIFLYERNWVDVVRVQFRAWKGVGSIF